LAGKRVAFFAMHKDSIINRHGGFCLAFLWGSLAFCFGLLSVAVVSQIAAENASFYSLITMLTYFSTSLYTTRFKFIKPQSLSGSIGVCAVRVGVPFVVAERWCFVRYGRAVAAKTSNKTNRGRRINKTVGSFISWFNDCVVLWPRVPVKKAIHHDEPKKT
jgi:hypothetical protein